MLGCPFAFVALVAAIARGPMAVFAAIAVASYSSSTCPEATRHLLCVWCVYTDMDCETSIDMFACTRRAHHVQGADTKAFPFRIPAHFPVVTAPFRPLFHPIIASRMVYLVLCLPCHLLGGQHDRYDHNLPHGPSMTPRPRPQ